MWFQLYYLSEWLIRIAMLVEVPRHRSPASSAAWLLVIFFFPLPGLILYLLIGAKRAPKQKIEQAAQLADLLKRISTRFTPYRERFHPALDPEAHEGAALVEQLGRMPVLDGNHVEVFDQAEDFFDRLIADIDAAKESVHLLFYIYEDDAVGRRVNEALVRAAKRGVTCRVLVDAVGSRKLLTRWRAQLLKDGVEMHDALPVTSRGRFFGRVDWRNHRKIVVIDGQLGYTGSQNIVDPSYGHSDAALVWRDLMARITGPAVIELQAIFVGDWYMETQEFLDSDQIFPVPETTGTIPIQVLPSGPIYPTENYQRLVVAAFYAAREQVTLTTPYFVPDDALMQAIEVACLRGVEVQLIVPKKLDQVVPAYAAQAYFDELLDYGVKIYLYTEGLLHAKTMSIDQQFCFFGTSNFDIRSFALDFEVNLVFYRQEETEKLRAQQQSYINQSEFVRSETWQARSSATKIAENLAKLFSPLL